MSQLPLREINNSDAESEDVYQRLSEYYRLQGWSIDKYLEPLLYIVSDWLAYNLRFETSELGIKNGWCLEKGLCIIGSVGSSKTSIMKALNHVALAKGSPATFHTYETVKLATAYQAEKGGGLDSLMRIKSTHMYYDEMGKREIAAVKHYSREGNIDRMLLESRYQLFADGGVLFHTTSNMPLSELEEWLTPKYYSRLRQMCNVIMYENKHDYRLTTVPLRRRQALSGAVDPAAAQKRNDDAREAIMERFVSEVLVYINNGEPLYLSNETMVFDSLVELGRIRNDKCTPAHPYYAETLARMESSLTRERAGLDVTEKSKARELGELLKQCVAGTVMTSMALSRMNVAFKQTVVREFVKVNLNTAEKVNKMFPKKQHENQDHRRG